MTVKLCTRAVRAGAIALVCLATVLATAQTERRFTFEAGGGVTPPVGKLSNRFNTGWNMGAGAGWNITRLFSLSAKYQFNGFGVNNGLLSMVGVPNGDGHVWSLTAEPRLQLGVASHFSPYVVGGVGYYRRVVNFTEPALLATTFFDPFFGIVFPGLVPANRVLRRATDNGIGGSLGAGLSFPVGHGAQFFTEARYHYANTGRIPTRMVPVTFGIRF